MNKLGTKLGAVAMSAVMALTFAPSAAITSLAASGDGLTDATLGVEAVHSVYNPNTGEHLFTTSDGEVDYLVNKVTGWKDEGVKWYTPSISDVPVYRVYNPNSGDHHYTTDLEERAFNLKNGWVNDNEGKPFFYAADSDDPDAIPVYRLFNPNETTGTHHYTTDLGEYVWNVGLGWKGEGSKFNGYPLDYEPEKEELTVSINNTTPKVGDTLTATVTPADLTGVTFQWYAGDDKIADETDATLLVTEDMEGKAIKVEAKDAEGKIVTSTATAAVVKPQATITDVDQLTANQVEITFSANASEVTKDQIQITNDTDAVVTPINTLEFVKDGDGTKATATLATPLKDKVSYTVSYGDSNMTFIASVGAVAAIDILTASAQYNTTTEIEYIIRDANGVDVTSSINKKSDITIDYDGDGTVETDPEKPTIIFDTEDGTCKITITYADDDDDTEDVVGKGEIVCVAAEAIKGTPLYTSKENADPDLNLLSEAPQKFYRVGTSDTTVKVAEGNTANVYFTALDDKGAAIKYTAYDIESVADDDIASASMDSATSGKFAKLVVNGNKEGNTTINLKAENNGAPWYYTISVTVYDPTEAVKSTFTATRTTMSNAYDVDYKGEVELKCFDRAGNEVAAEAADYTVSPDEVKIADKITGEFDQDVNCNGFNFNEATGVYTAWGAKGGTYTISVVPTVGDKKLSTKKVSITVQALPENVWNSDGIVNGTTTSVAPVDAAYQIELSSTSVGLVDSVKGENKNMRARLYATVNGKFAGYVRGGLTGGGSTVSQDLTKTGGATYTATVSGNGVAADTEGSWGWSGSTAADYLDPENEANAGRFDIAKPWMTDGTPTTIGSGTLNISNSTKIADGSIVAEVTFGGLYAGPQGQLYDIFGANEGVYKAAKLFSSDIELDAANPSLVGGYMYYKDSKFKSFSDDYFARAGSYEVKFTYTLDPTKAGNILTLKDAKVGSQAKKFVVNDDLYKPSIEILNRSTDFSIDDLKDCVAVDCDLNNNDGVGESLEAVLWTSTNNKPNDAQIVADTDGQRIGKWVKVQENEGPVVIHYYIPKGTTFKAK